MRPYSRIKWILPATLLLVYALSPSAWAKSQVNTNWLGQAVKGYDVVAYFKLGQAVKGNAAHEYLWQGAKWRFANADHLAAFKADPVAYSPQYGGY